jgi:malate dehydrogenase (oxaloacetate-decarboxylating)
LQADDPGGSRLNRVTAFTVSERHELGLDGMIPPRVLILEEQADRAYAQHSAQPTDLAKHVNLSPLHDRNEVLFCQLVGDHLAEMLPIVYTPTVGTAIERYSNECRRAASTSQSTLPRRWNGRYAHPGCRRTMSTWWCRPTASHQVDIGDWGVCGIDISVGKLAVYTAVGGIDPASTLPVVLHVGTNRKQLLDDPLYLDDRHPRVIRRRTTSSSRPSSPQQGGSSPTRCCTLRASVRPTPAASSTDTASERFVFNDDIQGTGAVNLAAVLSGVRASGLPLREHRVVVGAGTAGIASPASCGAPWPATG